MRRPLVLVAVIGVAAATAPAATGGITSVEMPRADAATSQRATSPFTMVGIHWRGRGRVLFRTRSLEGRWSGWRPAAPEAEDLPDPGSPELRSRNGWRVGNPWWLGPSDRIETRTVGRVARVRAHLVWSPEIRVPYRTPAATVAPPIVPRLSWGADESIRRNKTMYADAVRLAIVHHTAGRNLYSRAEAAAIVKGIQLYHVKGNGWNDIGYNFLVDRFGTVYEGRFGGTERNVIGAHAQGFNTGSAGIAVLGTYGGSAPSTAAQKALADLIAWRLDLAHVDPVSLLTFISSGSNRFRSGVPVLLRAVSGHRDTGFTDCPGDALYGRLNALAATAARIGLPKIYAPRLETGEGLFRFRARISSARAWVVSVTNRAGTEIARGTGTGTLVDWTWDSLTARGGTYAWTISAGSARPATGSLRTSGGGGNAGTLVVEATATPATLTPNGDGQADSAAIGYRLSTAASVTVTVLDGNGAVLATPIDRAWTRSGAHTVTIDGAPLADGRYAVVVAARSSSGVEVEKRVSLIVTRTLGLVTVKPALFSPNGDGRSDRLVVGFALTAPADVRARVMRDGRWVATALTASYTSGSHRVEWNGIRPGVGRLRDGEYELVVETSDAVVGTASVGVPFVADTTAPTVRFVPGPSIRLEVSEPGRLYLRIDGVRAERQVVKAGVVRVPWDGAAQRVRVVAEDAAGNRSRTVLRGQRT